jgi:uncharacterized protein DUF4189
MRAAAAVLALGMLLLTGLPAHADFGAVAYDATTGKRGWSIHEATPQKAERAALSACGAGQCKVVIRVAPKRCAAVAGIEGKKFIGAAARPSRDSARVAALADCQKRASGDCVVQFSDCNN